MNPNEQAWRWKKRLEQALSLTPEETGLVAEAPALTAQQEPKQEDLDFYAAVFSEAAQRHFPIREADRQELQYFQRVLHLNDAAVQTIEDRSLHQLGIESGNGVQLENAADGSSAPSLPTLTANSTELQNQTMQPVDFLSGEGSTTTTVNQAAVQRMTKQKAERNPASVGQTQPPDRGMMAESNPAVAAHAVMTEPPLRSPTLPSESDPVLLAQPVVPLQTTPAEAEPIGQSPPATPPPQTPVTVVAAAAPPPASDPAPVRQSAPLPTFLAKRFLFPLFGFLIGLTALGVIWLMARPFLQTDKADPQKAQQYVKWGVQKTQQGEYQEAISDFNDAIRLNPTEADVFINRGYAKHRSGDLNGAVSDYNQAIQLNPNSAQAHNNLSHVQFDQRKYNEAAKSAQQAIQLQRDLPEAHLNLGNARQATGDVDGAAAEFQTTIRLQANNITHSRAYNNLGNVVAARGQFDEAIRNYNEATQRDANYADAFFNRGLAHDRQGNASAAVQDLNRAAELYQAQRNNGMRDRAKQRAEQISNSSLRTVNSSLLTSHFSLSTIHYSLSTPDSSFLTLHSSLSAPPHP